MVEMIICLGLYELFSNEMRIKIYSMDLKVMIFIIGFVVFKVVNMN